MSAFDKTTANIAAWDLSGFHGIRDNRVKGQIKGLDLLDAEVVTLVEIDPVNALNKIKAGLKNRGVTYHLSIIPQSGKLHIGVLNKHGV